MNPSSKKINTTPTINPAVEAELSPPIPNETPLFEFARVLFFSMTIESLVGERVISVEPPVVEELFPPPPPPLCVLGAVDGMIVRIILGRREGIEAGIMVGLKDGAFVSTVGNAVEIIGNGKGLDEGERVGFKPAATGERVGFTAWVGFT
jgi:hypothetical protein